MDVECCRNFPHGKLSHSYFYGISVNFLMWKNSLYFFVKLCYDDSRLAPGFGRIAKTLQKPHLVVDKWICYVI